MEIDTVPALNLELKTRGRLAQLVRAPPSHGGGHWFESSIAHHISLPDMNKGPVFTGNFSARPYCNIQSLCDTQFLTLGFPEADPD